MPASMTGFGRGEDSRDGYRLQCEIRSVNHRFLSIKWRVPGPLVRYEPWIEERIRSRLVRGSVEIHLQHHAPAKDATSQLDPKAADHYRKMLSSYLKKAGGGELPPEFLFQLPGVLVSADPSKLPRFIKAQLQSAVDEALEQLVAMRQREGKRLEKVLLREAKTLQDCVKKLAQRAPGVVDQYRKKLTARLEKLLQEIPVDENSVAREVAMFADRSDVTEELDRLRSHLKELDLSLGKKGPIGRSLDFLVQEMARETNTIGSKMQDAQGLKQVLRAKGCVEKIREQVQNIE